VSNYENSHDDDNPRYEPWLGVMASAFVPVTAALYLPPSYLTALIGIAAALFAAGLVMLRRQTSRRARDSRDVRPPSAGSRGRSRDRVPPEMEGAEP
jgi:hypothetical protein